MKLKLEPSGSATWSAQANVGAKYLCTLVLFPIPSLLASSCPGPRSNDTRDGAFSNGHCGFLVHAAFCLLRLCLWQAVLVAGTVASVAFKNLSILWGWVFPPATCHRPGLAEYGSAQPTVSTKKKTELQKNNVRTPPWQLSQSPFSVRPKNGEKLALSRAQKKHPLFMITRDISQRRRHHLTKSPRTS